MSWSSVWFFGSSIWLRFLPDSISTMLKEARKDESVRRSAERSKGFWEEYSKSSSLCRCSCTGKYRAQDTILWRMQRGCIPTKYGLSTSKRSALICYSLPRTNPQRTYIRIRHATVIREDEKCPFWVKENIVTNNAFENVLRVVAYTVPESDLFCSGTEVGFLSVDFYGD